MLSAPHEGVSGRAEQKLRMLGSTMLQSLASIGGAATVSKLLLSSDERPAMEEETLTSSSSEREVGNCSGSTVVLVVLSGDEVIIEFLQICDDGVVEVTCWLLKL